MNGRKMFRQTSAKQTNAQTQALGNRTNRSPKVQADACYPSGKKEFKQQRQQR